ncbi:arylamine N-acetyltransferase family protein [Kitasatospora purpeofusca]|uniref:arylamine N-acetyltransferase family protein n=1 Tax=Kitasatospora purpeofusca TaxID=67352 RepID=UPI002A5AE3F3|nr:arylamine N-acetyltransferase [Kitasatospora purpeofusca]MDY0816392.1 arylamine N-acetyltransferase [Kitasatospora purpeofusca]
MSVDLDKYFARIGWDGGRAPTLDTLRSLQHAHVLGIPFENIDVVVGTVPSLDLADLEAKLVAGSRGGYCFEQNTLFAGVLEQLGYGVTRYTGRVRVGARPGEIRPRTHLVLGIEVPGGSEVPGGGEVQGGGEVRYLVDVGFGSTDALLEPLPMLPGLVREGRGRRHRLVVEDADGPAPVWVLQAGSGDAWTELVSFTLDAAPPPDIGVANWHVATHPRSPFRRLFVQRTRVDGHLSLDGTTLTRTARDGTVTVERVDGPEALRDLLEAEFGITPPPGVRPER